MSLLIFILGLLIGSFLNVCIYRIPLGKSIAYPPSHCPGCNKPLKAYELIPVISYILLRGSCSSCRVRISARYPFVELLNGLIFLFFYINKGLSLEFLFLIILSCHLIVIAFIDLDHMIIPDEIVISIIIISILYRITGYSIGQPLAIGSALLGLLVGGGVFLLVAILSGGGMGGGDIKLMGALGLFFGLKLILLTMLAAVVIGAIVSVGLLFSGKKKRDSMIPFGPFIVIGAYITALYGNQLIEIYMKYFIY